MALTCSSNTSLGAENFFLRKQLAFDIERQVKPRRLDDAARIALVLLTRLIDGRQLLTVVRPHTLVRWPPSGIPPVLALEVAAPWASPDSSVPPGCDRHDGASESDLG